MLCRAAVLLVATACTSFDDRDIVLDLRAIAMTAEPPEQLVDLDPAMPPDPPSLLAQLTTTRVCALVADPAAQRDLRYELTMCVDGARALGDRCDPEGPSVRLARGVIADPETTPVAPVLCGDVPPDGNLLGVLLEVRERDPLGGIGGLDYFVQLRIGGVDEDPARDVYGVKRVRVAPRIPVARVANVNPDLTRIDLTRPGAEAAPLPPGRCVDVAAPPEIPAGERVRFDPVEPPEAREPYLTPTLDGQGAMFTETLTYQWMASAGSFTAGSTGGGRDAFGNEAELFTEWTAPTDRLGDVELWIVQRDERLGVRWYQRCVRVTE